MVEVFKGAYGRVLVSGSRAIKETRLLNPATALTLKYAHKMAQVVLAPLGIDVIQYKIISAQPKTGRFRLKGKKLVRRQPGKVVMVSDRVPLDERSLAFFKHYAGDVHQSECNVCSQHRMRVSGEFINRIRMMLWMSECITLHIRLTEKESCLKF